jgi:hypothetical protein
MNVLDVRHATVLTISLTDRPLLKAHEDAIALTESALGSPISNKVSYC